MIKTKIKCKVMKKFLIGIDISKEKFDVTVIKSLGEGLSANRYTMTCTTTRYADTPPCSRT